MHVRLDALNSAIRCAAAGFIATSLTLFPLRLWALELGDLTLESPPGQPLQARIALTDLGTVAPGDVTVTLGSEAAFAQAGLNYAVFLSTLDFSVRPDAGGAVVDIRSSASPSATTLAFVVEATWPQGSASKTYTLALAPSAVAGAQAGNAADGVTVDRGDTLWNIAERTRPSAALSVQQMMVALHEANPGAFAGNDINRLLSGQVLRIPSEEEVRRIEPAAALARVNAQGVLGTQPLSVPAAAAGQGGGRDELTILSGDQGLAGGSADLEATIAQLENELMLSEENLDRARLENRELTERLTMLEEQIVILQNIITIEDERLAQMQTDLARQAEDAARALLEQRESSNGVLDLLRGSPLKWVVGLGGVVVLALGGMALANNRRRQALADADEYAFEDDLDDDLEIPDLSEAGAVIGAPLPPETETTGDERLLMSSRYRHPDDPDDGDTFGEGEQVDLERAIADAGEGPTLELDTLDLSGLAFDDTTVVPEDEDEPSLYPERAETASDTKLDLAVAYEAMGDLPGALEILDQVLVSGDEAQQAEAQRLKEKWQDA
ncbi:MAG TPA: FimV/HubP family polar landmark protein [Hyphomicrobiales bacterium]|nr:FimV/HubP family polar landmark protein [Hyphomicrobiales bacterium]